MSDKELVLTLAKVIIAASDGGISYDETEEVRHIANILLLPHQRFIEAQLKISRQESKA